MLTAIQQLIEELSHTDNHLAAKKAKRYLYAEKLQIQDAWNLGGHAVAHKDENYFVDGDEYYYHVYNGKRGDFKHLQDTRITLEDIKFLKDCNMSPHYHDGKVTAIKILGEDFEGSFLTPDDLLKLADVLFRYVKNDGDFIPS